MGDNWISISQIPDYANLILYPNGNDTVEQEVSSGASYECIDDLWSSPNDTDYIYWDKISYASSWFTMENHGTETGNINYVRFIARASAIALDQNNNGAYYIVYDDDSSTASSDNFSPVPIGYQKYYWTAYQTPSSATWTWNDIDNLKLGINIYTPSVDSSTDTLIIRPTGDNTINLLRSSGDDNYALVNEEIQNDSNYVFDVNDSSDYDLYDMENHTTEDGTINSVTFHFRCEKTSSSDGFCKARFITHGTTYSGDQETCINGSYTNFTYETTVNPNTSNPWTWDEIDGLVAGVNVLGTSTGVKCSHFYVSINYDKTPEIRTSQLYAVVNYEPTASEVSLSMPDSINVSHSRDISRFTFADGDYEIEDMGRSGKSMTISGIEYESTVSDMLKLKDMCHYGNIVTLGNLPDDNLNTNYLIRSFSWNDISYCDATQDRIYRWNIELEEA